MNLFFFFFFFFSTSKGDKILPIVRSGQFRQRIWKFQARIVLEVFILVSSIQSPLSMYITLFFFSQPPHRLRTRCCVLEANLNAI